MPWKKVLGRTRLNSGVLLCRGCNELVNADLFCLLIFLGSAAWQNTVFLMFASCFAFRVHRKLVRNKPFTDRFVN